MKRRPATPYFASLFPTVFAVVLGLTVPMTVSAELQGTGRGTGAGPDLPVILTVGESTTAGFGVSAELSYPGQLQALLSDRGYAYRVVNQGRNGITVAMALTGLDRGLRLQPRIVIIALGGNDRGGGVPEEVTRENLRRMIGLYVRIGSAVFLADRNAGVDGRGTGESSMFAALAAEEGAILMPSLREGVAGHPELLLDDGSHPNADGYTIVARRIFGLIEPYLSHEP